MDEAITSVYLVRHGETEWNVTLRCQGTADIPMNPTGHAQVASLGTALRSVAFAAAYTSPLSRARLTAGAVLASRALDAVVEPGLRELSYGDWQGLTPQEWPGDVAERWAADPWTVAFPNGESLAAVQARAVAAIGRIVAAHPGQCVLVAAHGHLNRLLLLHAHGADPGTFWDVAQPNGWACRIDYRAHDANAIATSITPITVGYTGTDESHTIQKAD